MKTTESKTLIFVPTYNEKENVEKLISEITELNLDCDLLFVDDNSPDGTGNLLDSLESKYPRLTVLHRIDKLGIGSAHYDGIKWAYSQGYERLITMDSDFTHPPKYIPILLNKAEDNAIVVGSRYLQEKSLKDWNLFRKTLTTLGHFMTKTLLRMPYDATGAFRLYDLKKIPHYAFDLVQSRGYSFFFESLYIFNNNKYKIEQIPIELPSRTYGHSKMSYREIFRSLKMLFVLYLKWLFNSEKLRILDANTMNKINDNKASGSEEGKVGYRKQEWEKYWENHKGSGGLLYDTIAAFYRKFIIKRNLNHFIKKYFDKDAQVLHAGCGSGQVDSDIRHWVSITGLDISPNALMFYQQTNGKYCKTLLGSILNPPLPDNSYDGVYHLGVLEHFTEDEIKKILTEFARILKPNGKMIVFWPPEFGLSVLFFKALTFIFKNILGKKDVKFHPDEITRGRSKAHMTGILKSCGFDLLEYRFDFRDLFTYSMIAVEKKELSV
ncbi:MAG: glycosyltransferase [Bacteriovoracaceae bacterium]